MINQKLKFWILIFSFVFCVFCFTPPCSALNLDNIKANFLNGDYKAAILEGEKILAKNSRHADLEELYYILGLSYTKDGNYLRASDIFEIILQEFKDGRFKEEAQLGLGDTYLLRGYLDKAESRYQELLQDEPSAKVKAQLYHRLSQVGFQKGDTGQGKEYLEKLKREFPLSFELKLEEDASILPPNGSSGAVYYTVQVGSFGDSRNARNLCDKLTAKDYAAYIEEAGAEDNRVYRVRIGKLKSRPEAVQLENKLSQEGYPTKICP